MGQVGAPHAGYAALVFALFSSKSTPGGTSRERVSVGSMKCSRFGSHSGHALCLHLRVCWVRAAIHLFPDEDTDTGGGAGT